MKQTCIAAICTIHVGAGIRHKYERYSMILNYIGVLMGYIGIAKRCLPNFYMGHTVKLLKGIMRTD